MEYDNAGQLITCTVMLTNFLFHNCINVVFAKVFKLSTNDNVHIVTSMIGLYDIPYPVSGCEKTLTVFN